MKHGRMALSINSFCIEIFYIVTFNITTFSIMIATTQHSE
jgi:hypothetical protein